jgi:transposase
MASALHGHWRPEHLFALPQAVELDEFSHRQLAACDRQIEAHLHTVADQSQGQPLPPRPRRRQRKANEPSFDARTGLSQLAGVDLTLIEGLEAGTARLRRSEIGTDMSRWPSVKHFCRGLGRCPQHQVSGGKILSRRVRPGANRAAQALRLAASCLHHSRRALGAFWRRLKSRMGTPHAITATAHQLARLVYSLLKHGTAYVAQGMEAYEQQHYQRQVKQMARKARELGFQLVPAHATV